jgi:L-threonylcarbamoyladenylate synthase
LLSRHYAPQTPLECVADGPERVRSLAAAGARVGLLHLGEPPDAAGAAVLTLPADPLGYAAGLYAALHVLDDAGLERIVVTLPPTSAPWQAVQDRLCRAAQ